MNSEDSLEGIQVELDRDVRRGQNTGYTEPQGGKVWEERGDVRVWRFCDD